MSSRPVRLIYGYLSASSQPINIKLPWQQTTNDGMFAMNYSRLDAERDNLLFWAHSLFLHLYFSTFLFQLIYIMQLLLLFH
jgi:hypothetical protein